MKINIFFTNVKTLFAYTADFFACAGTVTTLKIGTCYCLHSLYTGGLFHCYMFDKSICHFRGAGSILWLLFYFKANILLANSVNPDQTPRYVASDLGLHCPPMTLLRVSR